MVNEVIVTSGPESILLEVTKTEVVKNRLKVYLSWAPAGYPTDVYRNGTLVVSSVTTGSYTDNVKNSGTYTYQVKIGLKESNKVTFTRP
jgi:uncharacterized protein (UPF0371 family)